MEKSFWTLERQRIYAWIGSEGLQSFAETYKGAVVILYDRVPGYIRFVSHAVRDLMNGMAAERLGLDRRQVQYTKEVQDLVDLWEKYKLPIGPDLSSPGDYLKTDMMEREIIIPWKVLAQMQRLLREHKEGRLRNSQKPYLFFQAFVARRKEKSAITDPTESFCQNWSKLHGFFMNDCHESGQSPSKDVFSNIESQFRNFETILLCIADRYRNTITRIDEILEEANS